MQKATQVLCWLPGREQCSSGGAVKKFLNGTKKFPKGNGKIMGEKRELYLQKIGELKERSDLSFTSVVRMGPTN